MAIMKIYKSGEGTTVTRTGSDKAPDKEETEYYYHVSPSSKEKGTVVKTTDASYSGKTTEPVQVVATTSPGVQGYREGYRSVTGQEPELGGVVRREGVSVAASDINVLGAGSYVDSWNRSHEGAQMLIAQETDTGYYITPNPEVQFDERQRADIDKELTSRGFVKRDGTYFKQKIEEHPLSSSPSLIAPTSPTAAEPLKKQPVPSGAVVFPKPQDYLATQKESAKNPFGVYGVFGVEEGTPKLADMYVGGQSVISKFPEGVEIKSPHKDSLVPNTDTGWVRYKTKPTTESVMVSQAREKNPLRDVPVIGESGTTFLAGLSMTQSGLYHDIGFYSGPKEDLPAFEYMGGGAASLFVEGLGIGYAVGTVGVGGLAGAAEVGITGTKITGAATLFGGGVRVGAEGIQSVTEGRAFDLNRANLGELIEPEHLLTTAVLGIGTAGVGQQTFFQLGRATASPLVQQVGTGAVSGAVFGTGLAAASSGDTKPITESAAAGAALGATAGAANYYLEGHGYKPVAQETRVDVISPHGTIKQEITGVKIGVETIDPSSGKMGFKGVGWSRDITVGKGDVVRPTGIYEAQRYTPELIPMYEGAAKAYFSNLRVSGSEMSQNVKNVFGESGGKVLKEIESTGGTVGGSTVEKAITTTSGKSLKDMPSARQLPQDIDVAYYYNEKSPYELASRLGGTITKMDTPLQYEGHPTTTTKYHISAAGGNIDVSVMSPTPFEPAPSTPFGSYQTSFSFSKDTGVTTYSPQQQISSKLMTMGSTGAGPVPIEPGKTKYLQDVSAIMELGGGKALPGTMKTPTAPDTFGEATVPISAIMSTGRQGWDSGMVSGLTNKYGYASELFRYRASSDVSDMHTLPSAPSPSSSSIPVSTSLPSPSTSSFESSSMFKSYIGEPSSEPSPPSPSSPSVYVSQSSTSTSISEPSTSNVNIFDAGIIGAIPIPGFFPGGAGGGGSGRGGRTRVPGEIGDLLSIEKNSGPGTIAPAKSVSVEQPKLISGNLWGRRTQPGPGIFGDKLRGLKSLFG